MWNWLHRLGAPKRFYGLARGIGRWCGWASLLVGMAGLYYSLFASPADYQQGESVRIMYVHVPAAWLSMLAYMVIAAASVVTLVWRIKVADILAGASARIGAWFTFLALITGSLWETDVGHVVDLGRTSYLGTYSAVSLSRLYRTAFRH